jgi:hypothetical protein
MFADEADSTINGDVDRRRASFVSPALVKHWPQKLGDALLFRALASGVGYLDYMD